MRTHIFVAAEAINIGSELQTNAGQRIKDVYGGDVFVPA